MSIVLFFEYSDADFEPMAAKKQTLRPAIKRHQYKRQNGFDPNADPYGEITGQHNAVQGSNVVKQKRDKQQLADAKAAYLRTDCSSYPRGRWFKFSPAATNVLKS